MKPKVIYLEGGPKDGQITFVSRNVKQYYIPAPKKAKYVYKEDMRMKGLFIYTGLNRN